MTTEQIPIEPLPDAYFDMATRAVIKWEGEVPDPQPFNSTTHPRCREVMMVTRVGSAEITVHWKNPNFPDPV